MPRGVDIPFRPFRGPIFYGWVVVAVGVVGIIASTPGQTNGVGVFTNDLIAALGITRVELSIAYMLGTATSAFLLPLAGRLLDRVGVRVMFLISTSGLALALVYQAYVDTLVGALGRSMAAGFAAGYVGFLLLRFFGQGCLTMASRVLVGKWFNRRRGLAAGISGAFVTGGFHLAPERINKFVESQGWQVASLWLALVIGGGVALLGWVFLRDSPERCGLEMDGGPAPGTDSQRGSGPLIYKEFTAREARCTRAFWLFNAGVGTQALVFTAFAFHLESIGAAAALDSRAAFAVFQPMALFGIVSTFVAGWLSDRIRLKWLLLALVACQALGTTGILLIGDPLGRAMLYIGYGTAGGLFSTLVTVTWPNFYGRLHLGAVSGMNMWFLVLSSSVGPALFAGMHALTGDYVDVIAITWLLPMGVLVFTPWGDSPQEKFAPAPSPSAPDPR